MRNRFGAMCRCAKQACNTSMLPTSTREVYVHVQVVIVNSCQSHTRSDPIHTIPLPVLQVHDQHGALLVIGLAACIDTQKHKQTITHTQTPLLTSIADTTAHATSISARALKNVSPSTDKPCIEASMRSGRSSSQHRLLAWGELRTQKTSSE